MRLGVRNGVRSTIRTCVMLFRLSCHSQSSAAARHGFLRPIRKITGSRYSHPGPIGGAFRVDVSISLQVRLWNDPQYADIRQRVYRGAMDSLKSVRSTRWVSSDWLLGSLVLEMMTLCSLLPASGIRRCLPLSINQRFLNSLYMPNAKVVVNVICCPCAATTAWSR